MNVDQILGTFNQESVAYILVGGMNFLLRHAPILTYDVDLWIEDTRENLARCEKGLAQLDAEWGPTEAEWGPVSQIPAGWLGRQGVFCLTSPFGAIDVFRSLKGLSSWSDAKRRAHPEKTSSGISYLGLSDQDMLDCQLALPEGQRKTQRIEMLRRTLERGPHD